MTELMRDHLRVVGLPGRVEMGRAAADHVAGRLRSLLASQPRVRAIFAAAASQEEFLTALGQADDIDWSRVEAFHLDEYVGLPLGDPRSFGNWLDGHIFSRVDPGRVELMNGGAPDPSAECARYSALLTDGGLDLALIGVGENGHLAFNDPPADFGAEAPYLVVTLDDRCRRQQVGEGWFARIENVPAAAISMSIRQILAARSIVCVVPDQRKAEAVRASIEGPIDPMTPASILRTHPDVTIYLDRASASLLERRRE